MASIYSRGTTANSSHTRIWHDLTRSLTAIIPSGPDHISNLSLTHLENSPSWKSLMMKYPSGSRHGIGQRHSIFSPTRLMTRRRSAVAIQVGRYRNIFCLSRNEPARRFTIGLAHTAIMTKSGWIRVRLKFPRTSNSRILQVICRRGDVNSAPK